MCLNPSNISITKKARNISDTISITGKDMFNSGQHNIMYFVSTELDSQL